jgi:hypothetical protein
MSCAMRHESKKKQEGMAAGLSTCTQDTKDTKDKDIMGYCLLAKIVPDRSPVWGRASGASLPFCKPT